MKLIRDTFCSTGVFGSMFDETGIMLYYTLEHAFEVDSGIYQPAVPAGQYTCVRGQHQLAHMAFPFVTFEVTNVPGHSGILFHVGNTNSDSSGCILLGMARSGNNSILDSQISFDRFLYSFKDVDSFILTIE